MNQPNPFMRPVSLFGLLMMLALLLSACGGQIPATGNENAGGVAIDLTDAAVTVKGPAAPGVNIISVNNTGQTPRTVMLARLENDATLDQFMQALQTDEMAALELVSLAGGQSANNGQSSFIADLKEGTYAVIAFPQGEGQPLTTSLEVSGSPTGQAAPEAAQTFNMVDFAFVVPESVTAGQQTWQVTNTGEQWHEMIVLKPQPGFTPDQMLELFHANEEPQGEPPFEEIGSFGPISEGERGWMSLNLEPGTYMLVCFLPDFASGQSHLEKGMITSFEVTE